MIISHEHHLYVQAREKIGIAAHNGAYYYSREIVRNIIPHVKTDRNWVTINAQGQAADHSIVFIHNNVDPEVYAWLGRYTDLVLVCGVPSTCRKVAHLGRAIYLPLSIDVEEVSRYRQKTRKGRAYVGRSIKREGVALGDVAFIENLPRHELLAQMARYAEIFAVGRCAIEAKCLGARVLPFDDRYPDPSFWQVIDNSEAAAMLQVELDRIDRKQG